MQTIYDHIAQLIAVGKISMEEVVPNDVRERIEIAEGVASALEVVHAEALVHRNLCPETILIGFDRKPRLTDFDRAYIDQAETVFPGTEGRIHTKAYTAPELADAEHYVSSTNADMYSFGVLQPEAVACFCT